MHRILPARLKPGVRAATLRGTAAGSAEHEDEPRTIRGQALLFWDPKRPGSKLDAIDTDQITPASDCVSESLDTLDERWKVGAFRFLMPEFRARVHAGQNFLVAGDRFAIGSSREMSPAGLKAVAEEAGLELVVVCGNDMGDIFRRNALNLGLHVVQAPEAVADARDGDRFAFDAATRYQLHVEGDEDSLREDHDHQANPCPTPEAPSPQSSGGTTSQSTTPASGQVAGYPASGGGSEREQPRSTLEHSHA